MLLIVPPSETKRPPGPSGLPVDFGALSFPELTEARRRVLDALMTTSQSLDAFERLQVRPSMAPQVVANTQLLELPAMPVLDLYTGPVHEGLDAAGLSAVGKARAASSLVVNSPLWGLLRPSDHVPPYRLNICAHLVGLEDLEPMWREVLPTALRDAAGPDGLVVDIRSPTNRAAGVPAGIGDRHVWLRVDMGPPGHRIGEVIAKRIRGAATHHLLESGSDPTHLAEAAALLADRWPVRLDPPERAGKHWTLTLSAD